MQISIQGTRFERSLDVTHAPSYSTFQKVWDTIADFFCGTNIAEAKEKLSQFLNPNLDDPARAAVFQQLQALSAPAHQHHFTITAADNHAPGVKYAIGDAAVSCLTTTDLMGTDLRSANLTGADLRGIKLTGTDLRGKDLHDVDLRYAKLRGAKMSDANLSGAKLSDANLSGADLTRANLSGQDLSGQNLSDADLTGANLSGANLRYADLTGTKLTGANLSGALISEEQRALARQQGAVGLE